MIDFPVDKNGIAISTGSKILHPSGQVGTAKIVRWALHCCISEINGTKVKETINWNTQIGGGFGPEEYEVIKFIVQ